MQEEIAACEKLILTAPLPYGHKGWPVNVLEEILNCLRKHGRCLVEVKGGANEDVPTLAGILF